MKGILKAENVIRGRLHKAASIKGYLHRTPHCVNTEDATAEATDMFAPKTAYVRGEKVRGVLVKAVLETAVNGEFEPPENTLYERVIVAIPDPPLEGIKVTANGVYTPDEGVYGFGQVVVAVPDPVLPPLAVTENGLYLPGEGEDGFGQVLVNVKTIPDDCVIVNARDADGYMSDITIYGKIDANQFQDRTHLTKVNNAKVSDIGSYAFENCTGLAIVIFGDKSEPNSIGDAAFYGTALSDITIPDSVTYIGVAAFRACAGLTALTFGENSKLDTIGGSAVRDCTALKSIVIPASVTKIGAAAFNDATSMEVIYYNAVEAENTGSSTSVGGDAVFARCGATRLVIGNQVKVIPNEIFYAANNLETIDWGDSVDEIGWRAFQNCTALKSIVIPASVTKIGLNAFKGTTGIETVYYNAIAAENTGTSTSVGGRSVFTGSGVKRVAIGNQVKVIPYELFDGATNLETIDWGDSLEKISWRAFRGCTALKSIVVPASITEVGTASFGNTTGVETVYYNAIAAVNTGTGTSKGGRSVFTGSGVKTVIIGDGVQSLPRECFYGCASLTSIEFGPTLTEIGIRAFGNCASLTSVTIPANITSILSEAFYKCTALTDIYVPWAEGAVSGAPWGATAATIHYNHTGV